MHLCWILNCGIILNNCKYDSERDHTINVDSSAEFMTLCHSNAKIRAKITKNYPKSRSKWRPF